MKLNILFLSLSLFLIQFQTFCMEVEYETSHEYEQSRELILSELRTRDDCPQICSLAKNCLDLLEVTQKICDQKDETNDLSFFSRYFSSVSMLLSSIEKNNDKKERSMQYRTFHVVESNLFLYNLHRTIDTIKTICGSLQNQHDRETIKKIIYRMQIAVGNAAIVTQRASSIALDDIGYTYLNLNRTTFFKPTSIPNATHMLQELPALSDTIQSTQRLLNAIIITIAANFHLDRLFDYKTECEQYSAYLTHAALKIQKDKINTQNTVQFVSNLTSQFINIGDTLNDMLHDDVARIVLSKATSDQELYSLYKNIGILACLNIQYNPKTIKYINNFLLELEDIPKLYKLSEDFLTQIKYIENMYTLKNTEEIAHLCNYPLLEPSFLDTIKSLTTISQDKVGYYQPFFIRKTNLLSFKMRHAITIIDTLYDSLAASLTSDNVITNKRINVMCTYIHQIRDSILSIFNEINFIITRAHTCTFDSTL